MRGIFCANFATCVGGWKLCRGTWCAACYSSSPSLDFHTYVARVETVSGGGNADGASIGVDEDRLANLWRTQVSSAESFKQARPGDHLLVMFQCDLCVFRKLRRHDPDVSNATDANLLACIRRVNLDAFWSRATSTVNAQRRLVERSLDLSAQLGLEPLFPEPGPLPMIDHCGYSVAVQMVYSSISGGRYSDSHLEFDTIRRLRTVHTNYFRTIGKASASVLAMVGEDGRSRRFTTDPTASEWFAQFTQGCKRRMGQDWRPDQALSSGLMRHLIDEVERRVTSSQTFGEVADWITAGTYFVVCYVLSLRGSEGLLVDLAGLREHMENDPPHRVTVALLGKIKGEHHVKHHLLPSVSITSSGLFIKVWIKKLIAVRAKEGRVEGPAICSHEDGQVMTTSTLNSFFHEALIAVFDRDPGSFLNNIKSSEDVENKFNVFRSFRRGSDTRAIAQGVSKLDIEVVNRWKGVERAKGRRPGMSMEHHYADVNYLTEAFLRYTRAM